MRPQILRVSVDQVFELALVADIGRNRGGFSAGRPDRLRDLVAGGGLPARDHHSRAGGREVLGDRTANSPARTGHDRDLAGQLETPSSRPQFFDASPCVGA